MKKNLMSVLILALVFVNVVLSAIIMITLVPSTKQSNELITKVCSAIDLELESGKVYNVSSVPVDQLEVVKLNGGETMTFNLKDSADGTAHFVVADVSLSLNTQDDDYAALQPQVEGKEALIKEIVADTFLTYTYEDVKTKDGQEELKDELLDKVQELFDSDFVIAVNLSANYQ